MKLSVLSLNCQKNYNENLIPFLTNLLQKEEYDLFLLQEATKEVLASFESFPKYSVVNSKDKIKRLSLVSIIYNSTKCHLKDFFYDPILFDGLERRELKKPFQSFGIGRTVLDFKGIKITVGSIHLPSGFKSKRRLRYLKLAKKIMNEKKSDVSFFGGDCNFCFPSEVKKASKIVNSEFDCITSDLGNTLDSYYTESHLPYSWVYMNNILRKFGFRIKLKTDHFFVDKTTTKQNNIKTKMLSDRVSDHSPIEMVLEIN